MATWESKMPPFHETWSCSSMKSGDTADCTSSQMSDSKHFLGHSAGAFNTRSSSLSRQFSGAPADSISEEASYQNELSTGHATGGAAPYNLTSVADTKPGDYSVTASTAVATTGRGSSKSSGLLGVSGGASTKATKKRARASRKPPTTVLEADSSNFRAMVQQLTGIPALPFLPTPMQQHQRHGLEFLDLVRPPSKSLLGFGAQNLQGLPPMDPSSLILNRGQNQQLHPEVPNFNSPYFKYLSAAAAAAGTQDHSRRPPSMGDFLRTPLDELGLDQKQQVISSPDQQEMAQRQSPLLSAKLEPSMPLLWEGSENPRDLHLNDMPSKYKSSRTPEVGSEGGAPEAPSSQAHIVDSWLSQTDPGADSSRVDSLL